MAWRRVVAIAAVILLFGMLALYGLLGAVGVPLAARKAIRAWEAQTPGLQVGLRALSFNPWTWNLRMQGLDVRQAGQSLISLERLEIGLSARSLFQRALVLNEVAVQGLSASLHWDSRGHLDIERILPQVHRQRAPAKARPLPLWQIDHLAITALQLRVVDPAVGLSDALELSLPSLELDHIGTLHGGDDRFALDLHGRYGDQSIWDLHWQGDIDFAPFSSSGHLQLAHLSLPWLGESLGHRLPLELRQGQLDFEADYQLAEDGGQQRLAVQKAVLDIRQLDVSGKGNSPPEFSLQQLHVQAASIDTVRHRVLGEVLSLRSPHLVLHRNEQGRLDLISLTQQTRKLGAAAPATGPAPPSPRSARSSADWTVSWPLAEVQSASLRFDDRSLHGFGDLRVPSVDVRVENLQNIDDGPLRIAMHGNGLGSEAQSVTARWSANASVRPRSGAFHLTWNIQDLDLGQLATLLAREAKPSVRQGRLMAQGQVDGDFRHPDKLQANGSAQLRQIELQVADGVALRGEQLDAGSMKWAAGHLIADQLGAQGVHASQGERQLELQGLSASGLSVDPEGPKLALQRLQLSGMKWDSGASAALQLRGGLSQTTVQALRWDGSRRRFAAQDLLLAKGGVSVRNATRDVRLRWKEIELQSLRGDLSRQRLALESLAGSDWSWQGRQPWVKVPKIGLKALRIDVPARRASVGTASASDAEVMLSRRKDGGIQPMAEIQSILQEANAPSPAAGAGAPIATPSAGAQGSAWQFALQGVELGLSSLRFEDHRGELPPLAVTDLVLRTGAWSSSSNEPLQEHLQLSLDGGQWQWDGTIGLQPPAIEGRLSVQHVDLQPLQGFLPQGGRLSLERSSASTSGKLAVRRQGPGYSVHYDGSLQLGDTRIADLRDHQAVLSWSGVDVPQLTLDWPGEGLRVPKVDLDNLYTRITVEADHHANWQTLLSPSGAPAPPVPPPRQAARAPLPLRIDQLNVKQASADFSDQSLRTPFAATIQGLTGQIGPFASGAAQQWTELQLKGRVGDAGHVEVSGRLMPLARPLRLEAGLHFRSIELPTLNPYAAEFAGYRIDQGKLDLQLQYSLEQGRIEGSNRARIDQLVLGPQVRTEGVPDLPLHLIIDILRNDDGVIELEVPVQGDLNNPSLTLRDIAFKALEGLLRDVVESPFRLVANLLGSDTDTLRHIAFAPGGAELSAHDRTKLENIAQVLGKHQKLLLFIRPAYNPVADRPPSAPAQPPAQAQASATPAPADPPGGGETLRALALQRAEAIRGVLTKAGIHNHRIFINEPDSVSTLGKSGTVLTTIDLKAP